MRYYRLKEAKQEIQELLVKVDCQDMTNKEIKNLLRKDEHLHSMIATEIQPFLKEKYNLLTIGKAMQELGFYNYITTLRHRNSRQYIFKFLQR